MENMRVFEKGTDARVREAIGLLKYENKVPSMLSKFYDVKSLLLKEIERDTDNYYQLEKGIKKLWDSLEKKVLCDVKIYDLTSPIVFEPIPVELENILSRFVVVNSEICTEICVNQELQSNVYIYLPRGERITLYGVDNKPFTSYVVQNVFNVYSTEGFTLSFNNKSFSISIQPGSESGLKGSGEVYVYVWDKSEKIIYKDLARKYFNVDGILNLYRG